MCLLNKFSMLSSRNIYSHSLPSFSFDCPSSVVELTNTSNELCIRDPKDLERGREYSHKSGSMAHCILSMPHIEFQAMVTG